MRIQNVFAILSLCSFLAHPSQVTGAEKPNIDLLCASGMKFNSADSGSQSKGEKKRAEK